MAHFALGGVCMWTKRSDRAVAEFQQAIKLNPSFAAAHLLFGQMYLVRAGQGRKPKKEARISWAEANALLG